MTGCWAIIWREVPGTPGGGYMVFPNVVSLDTRPVHKPGKVHDFGSWRDYEPDTITAVEIAFRAEAKEDGDGTIYVVTLAAGIASVLRQDPELRAQVQQLLDEMP